MQASKIIPGNDYAVERSHGKLARFRVVEVNTITKRKGAQRSPHDSRSEVVGFFNEGESERDEAGERKFHTLNPDSLKGAYQDFVELVERKRAEEAAKAAQQIVDREQSNADRLALYAFVGVEPPKKAEEYAQLFRITGYYATNVDISNDGVRAIIKRVHELANKRLRVVAS